ncbi:hypothetical protein AOA12_03660 [Microbacterium sp. No. 7]|nr:hypothetical protein AOA12_03660 [Microbacterium sp. No. 7]
MLSPSSLRSETFRSQSVQSEHGISMAYVAVDASRAMAETRARCAKASQRGFLDNAAVTRITNAGTPHRQHWLANPTTAG